MTANAKASIARRYSGLIAATGCTFHLAGRPNFGVTERYLRGEVTENEFHCYHGCYSIITQRNAEDVSQHEELDTHHKFSASSASSHLRCAKRPGTRPRRAASRVEDTA